MPRLSIFTNRAFIATVFIMAFTFVSGSAQNFCGRVVDENGQPLPYSTVRVQKRPIAAMSDSAGNFSLPITGLYKKDTLTVAYMGYMPLSIAATELVADSAYCFRLTPMPTALNEVTVGRAKGFKAKKQGNKRNNGMFRCFINGNTAGDTFGYEVHAKKNRRMLLDKVGFYFNEGEKQMRQMKFRINVYDMNGVKKGPTTKFVSILPKPIYFNYESGDETSGKFVYSLPDYVVLPTDAVVAIEFLEDLADSCLYFKGNMLGKKTWSRNLLDGEWDTSPFSTPFFIECVEETLK